MPSIINNLQDFSSQGLAELKAWMEPWWLAESGKGAGGDEVTWEDVGTDPLDLGGGGGIQFDTYPQAGNWLYVETDDSTDAPNVAGLELYDKTAGGAWIHADNGITIENTYDEGSGATITLLAMSTLSLNAQDPTGGVGVGDIYLNAARRIISTSQDYTEIDAKREISISAGYAPGNGGDLSLYANDGSTANGDILLRADGSITLLSFSDGIEIGSYSTMYLWAVDNITVQILTGKTLTVTNNSNNPIFRVDEDGDLHGLTGKALTFDL